MSRKRRLTTFGLAILLLCGLYWWIFSYGPYPWLTWAHGSEIQQALIVYWQGIPETALSPRPLVKLPWVFEYTETCSVVSVVLLFPQGQGNYVHPNSLAYKLEKEGNEWIVVTEAPIEYTHAKPFDLNCES